MAKKHKHLDAAESSAVLKSFHKVLKNQSIAAPVHLHFGDGLCWQWVCAVVNGVQQCGWRQVPC